MVTTTIKELEAARSKVAAIEAALAKKNKELASLHTKHGFSDVNEFIEALKYASRGTITARGAAATSSSVNTAKRGKRAKITPEIKQRLKALVGEGKTGNQIAAALGISLPSVQNIKKELGLVKGRK